MFAKFLSNFMRPIQAAKAGLSFLFLLTVVLLGVYSCTKDGPVIRKNSDTEQVTEARDNNESFTYYLDDTAISEDQFLAADSNFYRHFVKDVVNNVIVNECRVFTTRQKYESWGDARDYHVSNLNRIEDRLKFVADSANLPTLALDTNYVIPSWFTNLQTTLMQQEGLANSSPDFLCFVGGDLNQAMCNPSLPPGTPWTCFGVSNSFTVFYSYGPHILGPFMNDKASAWLPRKSIICASRIPMANFRGFSTRFFTRRIGTITVNLNALASLPSGLFVPFTGIYASFDNRVSSFIHWGD